jgi:hypothetical protein
MITKNKKTMSLTSFLSDKNFKEVKVKLKTIFPRPKIKFTESLLAPPMTTEYNVIGNAFDYLIRFMLEYRYKDKVNCQNILNADSGYEHALGVASRMDRLSRTDGKSMPNINKNEYTQSLTIGYEASKSHIEKYLKTGKITDGFIRATLFYGRLDLAKRSGDIDINFDKESQENIRDMKNLISIIKESDFMVNYKCYLNPTFGEGGGTVGGADADVIIDDTLIEIKTTKELSLDRSHLNQILGYYILSLIGGVNGDKDIKPIKNIGIYFARYGVLWKVPVSSIGDDKMFEELKEWWISYTNDKLWTPMKQGIIPLSNIRSVGYVSERQKKLMENTK